MNDKVELAHVIRTYDVDYKGKNYSVIRSVDQNVGYADVEVMYDGEPVEDMELFDEICEFVEESITKGDADV